MFLGISSSCCLSVKKLFHCDKKQRSAASVSLRPLVLRRTPRMPTCKAMNRTLVKYRTSPSPRLSVTLPSSLAPSPTDPWTTAGTAPPHHWTIGPLLLPRPHVAQPKPARSPAAGGVHPTSTEAGPHQPSARSSFILQTTTLLLLLQLCLHLGRAACRPALAPTPTPSATRP